MARFRMLSENFFNVAQYTAHTITASTYQAGNEPWRVGTARRSDRNAWISPSTGEQWVRVSCDQVRAADMLVLDRGHNLTACDIQFTNSTAAGWTSVEDVTLPTATYPNTRITDSPGVRTPEGAWVYRFATTSSIPAAQHWRLSVSTTAGAGVKVVGAYLGRSFAPRRGGGRPWDDGALHLQRAEVASSELWTAASRVAYRRSGSLTTRLSDKEGDQAEFHVRDLYHKGELAWIVPNEDQAEGAMLCHSPSGDRSIPYSSNWPTRVLTLDWLEHQPKPR